MKRGCWILLIGLMMSSACIRARAQSYEIQQLLLDCEKLTQMKDIYGNMVKGYDILSEGYQAVKDISEGNFDLHQVFLDELLKASPVVRKYYKIAEIINCQMQIVSEYGAAYKRFKADNNFSVDEILYIGKVYDNLVGESLEGLGDLTTVLTDGALRASDDERLQQIDMLDKDMRERLAFLRYFNNNTSVLSLQRTKEKNDANTMSGVYGVE
jgi:hypothetical protein